MTDQATLSDGYRLLVDRERVLCRRLAVFHGSFTLDAAAGICGDGDAPDGISGLLSRLVALSLLIRRGNRFSLEDAVRARASAQLRASGEMDTLRHRHQAWFQRLAERPAGGRRSEWLDSLEQELDNFRAAFAWSLERGDLEAAYRLVAALSPLWCARGHLTEGREWLESLRKAPEDLPREVKAESLLRLGLNTTKQGEHDLATALIEQSLDLFTERNDPHGMARAANALGVSALRRGHHQRARTHFEGSLAAARRLGDDRRAAVALNNLGLLALKEGDEESASSRLVESLALARGYDDRTVTAAALTNLGGAALRRGDPTEARAHLEESLGIYVDEGERAGAAECLEGIAALALSEGQEPRAARLIGAAEAIRQAMGLSASQGDSAFAHLLDGLQERLTDPSLSVDYLAGRAMPFDETVAYALAHGPLPVGPPLPVPDGRTLMLPDTVAALTICGLGPVQVQRAGRILTRSDWTYSKARELLFLLLNHPHRTKEQIGVALWPDISPAQLRGTFRTTMYHLRRTLGQRDWILYTGERYAFNRSRTYWYDVEAFERGVAEARGLADRSPADAMSLIQRAIGLYRGPYLEDFSDGQWFMVRREELEKAFLDALLLWGQLAFDQGSFQQSAEAYLRAIRLDGYLEIAHRQLMRCYQALGERALALRHYDEFASRLRDDLGIAPDEETAALAARLRASDG